ncbi:unnamed protein product [Notodromas monacha]|uniref:Calponin-homology (CH) domain-containing protein n=1 Tax=Notodromas monacha TaxID=399045 RepID=A0A7R9G7K6_9CRUS|nr:unnamed protein product [Notodromas monacha]CAG0912335.1 unnamed protein product [Notodromas monacha]
MRPPLHVFMENPALLPAFTGHILPIVMKLQHYGAVGSLEITISDVVGHENAKEALLRWAQRTTEKYPGVRVTDFTRSWRDGLAFNAIIHRHRPDLIQWNSLKNRSARERLDSAFNIAEKEYSVTRLLDPEVSGLYCQTIFLAGVVHLVDLSRRGPEREECRNVGTRGRLKLDPRLDGSAE